MVVVPATVEVNPPTICPTGQSPAVAAVITVVCTPIVAHGTQATGGVVIGVQAVALQPPVPHPVFAGSAGSQVSSPASTTPSQHQAPRKT